MHFLRTSPVDPNVEQDIAGALQSIKPDNIFLEADAYHARHARLHVANKNRYMRAMQLWSKRAKNSSFFREPYFMQAIASAKAVYAYAREHAAAVHLVKPCSFHPCAVPVEDQQEALQTWRKIRRESIAFMVEQDYLDRGLRATNGNRVIDRFDDDVIANMQAVQGTSLYIGCLMHGGKLAEEHPEKILLPRKDYFFR